MPTTKEGLASAPAPGTVFRTQDRGRRQANILFSSFLGVALFNLPFVMEVDDWTTLTLRALGAAQFLVSLADSKDRTPPHLSSLTTLGLLFIAPSLTGENSSRLGFALVAIAIVAISVDWAVTGKERIPAVGYVPWGTLMLLAAYWFALELLDQGPESTPFLALYFLAGAIAVLFLSFDVRQLIGVLRLYATTIAILGFTGMLAVLLDWSTLLDGSHTALPQDSLRANFGYLNWLEVALTSREGPLGIVRATQIAGEPGTWATLCGIGLAASIVTQGRLTALIRLGCAFGIVSSQSFGAWLSIGLAAFAVAASLAILGRLPARTSLTVLASSPIAFFSGKHLLSVKAEDNVYSFADRGLTPFANFGSSTSEQTRISLLSTFGTDGPLLTLLPTLACVALIVATRRSTALLVSAISFALMAFLVQPTTLHPSSWIVTALVLTAYSATQSVRNATPGTSDMAAELNREGLVSSLAETTDAVVMPTSRTQR